MVIGLSIPPLCSLNYYLLAANLFPTLSLALAPLSEFLQPQNIPHEWILLTGQQSCKQSTAGVTATLRWAFHPFRDSRRLRLASSASLLRCQSCWVLRPRPFNRSHFAGRLDHNRTDRFRSNGHAASVPAAVHRTAVSLAFDRKCGRHQRRWHVAVGGWRHQSSAVAGTAPQLQVQPPRVAALPQEESVGQSGGGQSPCLRSSRWLAAVSAWGRFLSRRCEIGVQ